MNKSFSTECLVLKNSNYKDADKLYTFFSPEYGKFSAVAKGVRKINSRRLGCLDTLNRVRTSFTENFAGRKSVQQVQVIESYKDLKSSIWGITKGLYMAELIHRFFLHETSQPETSSQIYSLLIRTFKSLNKFYIKYTDEQYTFIPIRMTNMFETKLMEILGYEMSLDNFFLNHLEISDSEVEYLKSLKTGAGFNNLKLLKDGHKAGDSIIKGYISEVLDEPIYSSRLL